MRNEWVGDIGDFGKYGLLRFLCPSQPKDGGPFLKLGVVWYRTSREPARESSGNTYNYLSLKCDNPGCECKRCRKNGRQFRDCDADLWGRLRDVIRSGPRSVADIHQSNILGEENKEVVFYSDLMTAAERRSWAGRAVHKVADCTVTFLDPDTGLEPKKTRELKHVFLEELAAFWLGGRRSIVLYQHFTHEHFNIAGSAEEQCRHLCRDRAERIRSSLQVRSRMFALRWHRVQGRWFIFVEAPQHRDLLFNRAKDFLQTEWGKLGHFTMMEL